jgi:predicted regulator of amino acid metabolism with ACT domain
MLLLGNAFSGKGGQKKVAEFMLRTGVCIKNGKLFFSGVELSFVKVSRALGVDRRVVKATVATIAADKALRELYGKLGSTVVLKDVAASLGLGAIEIIPKNAQTKGIVASVARLISDEGISIRQVTIEDPLFSDAEMTVVTEKPIPRELIDKLLKVNGVRKVVVIN